MKDENGAEGGQDRGLSFRDTGNVDSSFILHPRPASAPGITPNSCDIIKSQVVNRFEERGLHSFAKHLSIMPAIPLQPAAGHALLRLLRPRQPNLGISNPSPLSNEDDTGAFRNGPRDEQPASYTIAFAVLLSMLLFIFACFITVTGIWLWQDYREHKAEKAERAAARGRGASQVVRGDAPPASTPVEPPPPYEEVQLWSRPRQWGGERPLDW